MADHAPSYYAASANPFAIQPALAGDLRCDVVVVGGGFTGLSAALHAAEAGFDVVLLEARRIGWGASGRNGGQAIPGLRWGADDLVRAFGAETARRLILLANSAREAVLGRIERHAIACAYTPGHFHAAAKPAHLDAMRRELDSLQALTPYPSAELIAAPDSPGVVASPLYHGGLLDRNGGHLHPLNYALGLAQAAREAGVRICEHSAVTALDDHAAGVRAQTAAGTVTARFAVLACDTEMAGLDPRLGAMTMGIANYNVATVPLDQAAAQALIPSRAAVADSKFVLNYFRLSPDDRLIFGGGEKYSPRPPADIAGFVRPYLERVFPQLTGIGIAYAWGGMVGVTLNRLPQMGRRGHTFYAHGWSGHGVLLTTLAGQLIAEAMRGTAERFDLFARLPARPFPGGRLLRHPLSVLGMVYYALKDRL